MIFVTVGSQMFQFNRLLKEIDRLIEEKKISSDEVLAQIGHSSYKPVHYKYSMFLNKSEFLSAIDSSTIIITHGGTGTIINGVQKGKKVIGVPRLVEFEEHVDNHQYEIIEQFSKLNLIYGVFNINDLHTAIKKVKKIQFEKYKSNTESFIKILEDIIKSIQTRHK